MGFQTSFIVENDEAFARALDRLGRTTDDFRIPYNLIANHWLRGNSKLFSLRSEGLYQPLAPSAPVGQGGLRTRSNYAERKRNTLGFDYPIFRGATGRLEASLVSKGAPGNEIFIGRKVLIMGTSVDYAIYHQSDKTPRTRIPQRKLIFIDGGPAEVARDALISGRLEAWLNIINDHITQILTGKV